MSHYLPTLYLASKSPRRQEILNSLHVRFSICHSPYEEKMSDVAELRPKEMAAKLAGLKAFHAANERVKGLFVGADTIVVLQNTVLGKPKDRPDARRMLESLSGCTHQVITGVAVVDAEGLRTRTHAEVTKVKFKDLKEKEILTYLDSAEPYDKAGAYAIQGFAGLFVEAIEGCYYNVVGFPLLAFSRLLQEFDLDLIDYMEGSS